MQKDNPTLSVGQKAGWGLADMGVVVFVIVKQLLVLSFLTNYLNVSVGIAGLLTTSVLIFDIITDPICNECHLNDVRAWLEDIGFNGLQRMAIGGAIKNSVKQDTIKERRCILCGENSVSTCSYCFYLLAARELKKLGVPHIIVKSFLKTFNYRQGHSDYFL